MHWKSDIPYNQAVKKVISVVALTDYQYRQM